MPLKRLAGIASLDSQQDRADVSSQIADLLRAQIVTGALQPGSRIPSERDIVEQLGVARSAVREALRELRAQGLIISGKGRQGTRVAYLADTGIGEPLAQLLQGNTSHLIDLMELRRGLEVQSAGLAARRRNADDVKGLGGLLSEMGAQPEKRRWATLDAAFHGAIAQATNNVFYVHVTAELVRLLQAHIPAILDILYTDVTSTDHLLAQHAEILDAISVGDEERARKAMVEHLDYVSVRIHGLATPGPKEKGSRVGLPGNVAPKTAGGPPSGESLGSAPASGHDNGGQDARKAEGSAWTSIDADLGFVD